MKRNWFYAVMTFALMAIVTAPLQAQTCVAGRNAAMPFFGNSNPDPSMSHPSVFIFTNPLGRQSLTLLDAATSAADSWSTTCPRVMFGSVPKMEVNWTSNRAGDDYNAQRTGVTIDFRDEPAEVLGPGDVSIAKWDPNTNTIIAFRRCPVGEVKPEIGCSGNSNDLINWGSPYGRMAMTHEVGHALGLEHDRTTSGMGATCPKGIMNAHPSVGDQILSEYCSYLNRANDDKLRCNDQSPEMTEGGPCEKIDRIRTGERPTDGIREDFCSLYPWLCDGGPADWGGSPLECNYYCVSYFAESYCDWGCYSGPVAVSPWDVSTDAEGDVAGLNGAPRVGLDSPVENATVTGIITLTGYAHEFFRMPTVEFGVDSQEIPLVSLQTGLSRPGVSPHPQGNPNSGFIAKLDTRRLANGQHTLQITATNIYGFPTKLERVITTNNSCFDYTLPSAVVNVPSPATGVVTVTANASDNNGVTKVDFYVDNVYKATDNAAPFVFSWDTNQYTAGTHSVEARAYDGCQNTGINKKTVTVTKPANAAQFISQSGIPTVMSTGQTATVSVTLKNIGTTTWTANGNYRLGSRTPENNTNWAVSRVYLPAGEIVPWNSQKTFTWTITAPSTPGTYVFQWQMLKEMVEWFGDMTPAVSVTVAGTSAGYKGCYTDDPTRAMPYMLPGNTYTVESCKQAVTAAGYLYAGLQYYGYCFGGNSLAYTKVAESECNTPCTSNNTQMCGGAWRNSVYTAATAQPPLYRGTHDTLDCSRVTGWACDANSAVPINVAIYEGSTYLGSAVANQQREAAVGAYCGGYTARGFTYELPDWVRNNANHNISVRFTTGANLTGSPKAVYCAGSVPVSASISWIQPAETSWGAPGTLTAAGLASNGTGNVQLVYRERADNGVWGAWQTIGYQAVPNSYGQWTNTISSGNPTNKCHHFDAYVNYSGVTSPVFHYTGWTGCP